MPYNGANYRRFFAVKASWRSASQRLQKRPPFCLPVLASVNSWPRLQWVRVFRAIEDALMPNRKPSVYTRIFGSISSSSVLQYFARALIVSPFNPLHSASSDSLCFAPSISMNTQTRRFRICSFLDAHLQLEGS